MNDDKLDQGPGFPGRRVGRRIVRSVLALLAGYAVIVVVQTGLTFGLAAFWGIEFDSSGPAQKPPVSYSLITVVIGAGVAALGGYVAARLAGYRPALHGWLLGGVLFLGGTTYQLLQFWNGLQSEGPKEPLWYLLLLPALGLLGAVLGGVLRAHQEG